MALLKAWPFGVWSGILQDAHYAHRDYTAEATTLVRLLGQIRPDAQTLLDIACGTGQHLKHLRNRYDVAGLDLDERVLADAAKDLPGVPLHHADMTSFDLGRTFDVVMSLFTGTGYLLTTDRLRNAIVAMASHLEHEGVLLVEPWLTPSTFRDNELVHGVYDSADLKVSWMYVQRRRDDVSVYDMNFQVGTVEDGVATFSRHEEIALFTMEEYIEAFRSASLHVLHVAERPWGYGLYVARKGAPWSADEEAAIERILSQ